MLTLLLPLVLSSSPESRAAALVAKMTTEEKVGQLMMDAPAIPRLGIPKYHWWSEALHGVAYNGVATVFPQAIGLASTWDTELMHRVSTAISIEARAKNNQDPGPWYHGLTLWSPNVNIFRDPRWGRGQETYGEDPFLTSRMGVAFVRGIQGDDPNLLRCVATPKHFAVHSGPEPLRHAFDARTPERDLYETYLPAFEACIREGHAKSIMSAYSAFNGQYCTGSRWLLTTLLRNTWGFDGAVVSDVDSVRDLLVGHKVAKDDAEAAAMALKAGDDLNGGQTYRALPEALKRGLVTDKDLDRAAIRLFALRYRLGMFDENRYRQIPASEIDSPAHQALNTEAAKKSLVLLKNDGLLPFGPSVKKLAVIGPVADDVATLVGNYPGVPSHPVTILAGLRKRGVQVEYARGCPLVEGANQLREPFPSGSIQYEPGKVGFRREIYRGKAFEERIRADSTPAIDFQWSTGVPSDLPQTTDYSIRWSTTFTPPASGEATFGVAADDGMRLYLDDRLVVEDWKDAPERSHTVTVPVTEGRPIRIRLDYYQGSGEASAHLGVAIPGDESAMRHAVEVARRADAVVLALGITPQLEGEEMGLDIEGFKGGDRTAIELPKVQRELWAAVRATGKPTVVVLTGGSALAFDPSAANAVLDQWYSGGLGGDAVAGALFGDFSPSGHLPVTFYRSTTDLPPFQNYAMAGRTYRYFGGRPLYPFGFGLSYTRFELGKPRIESGRAAWHVTVPVANTGAFDGDEVVQVYARPLSRRPGDPIRSLVGFARVSVPRGVTRSATIAVPHSRLRLWNPASKRYEVRAGAYVLEVGESSADPRMKTMTLQAP